MSTVYDELDERLIGFIRRQKLFFVATAPLSADGSVNVSPKGYDSLAIIDGKTSPTSTSAARGSRPTPMCAKTAGSR